MFIWFSGASSKERLFIFPSQKNLALMKTGIVKSRY